jgi:hypothetical protein
MTERLMLFVEIFFFIFKIMRKTQNTLYGPNAGIFMLQQLVCVVRSEAEKSS